MSISRRSRSGTKRGLKRGKQGDKAANQKEADRSEGKARGLDRTQPGTERPPDLSFTSVASLFTARGAHSRPFSCPHPPCQLQLYSPEDRIVQQRLHKAHNTGRFEMDYALPVASSSFSGGAPSNRRDSSSSDEDGLREVSPEELEALEMEDLSQLDPAAPNAAPVAPANPQNPHFNGTWDRDQSGIAKKLGLCVTEPRKVACKLFFSCHHDLLNEAPFCLTTRTFSLLTRFYGYETLSNMPFSAPFQYLVDRDRNLLALLRIWIPWYATSSTRLFYGLAHAQDPSVPPTALESLVRGRK